MNRSHAITGFAAFAPEPGYWGRMRIYLGEMYPPLGYLLFAALLYTDLAWLAHASNPDAASPRRWLWALGVGGVFIVGLLTRLIDELKDESIDRRLFAHRPLPSGRVRRSDIERSIVALILLYAGLSIGTGAAGWGAVAVLLCLLLSHRHFFMRERLERNLPLTLLTHGPLLLIVLCAFASLGLENGARPWSLSGVWALMLPASMFWTLIEGVEVARKIRAPDHETAYDTYSKVWGPAPAVLVAAALQTWTLAAEIYLSCRLALPLLIPSVLLATYGVLWFGYGRFLLTLTPQSSRLDRYACFYAMSTLMALFAARMLLP